MSGRGNLRNSYRRFGFLGLFFITLFLLIVVRLAWVQIVSGTEYGKKATVQITDKIKKMSPRGRILDRNGEELAVSIMANSLYADPSQMEDNPKNKDDQGAVRNIRRLAARLLAPVLDIKEDSLYEDFSLKGQFVWIKRSLSPKESEVVETIIKEHNIPGLHFEKESKRYYNKRNMAAQVLGFVGTDDSGLAGIELVLDSVLKGSVYRREEKVDALGRPVAESGLHDKLIQDVSSVYLTLDSKMQFVLEDAMDDAIKRTNAAGAAAIIMDPYTGEILGMASRPTFDPNDFGEYPSNTWLNRAISIVYEPGSVFKPIVGIMGLAEGLITPSTIINDQGSIQVADRRIRNWDGSGMGQVPFSDVIKYSINTGMVELGLKLGAKREIEYTKRFGFGEPTGIELPGEEEGILYNPDDMYLPDVATLAIGQGIAVTPLQVVRAISFVANGGELVQPYIIDKVVAPNGEIIRQGRKKIERRVISEEVAAQMRGMMEEVVSSGGGKTAAIKGYRIAGKTGTAEKLAEGGGYAAGKYIASFVGFVPADKPQYVMLVMLDTPQGAFYGSQVSAPIFRDTLQQILVAKGIQPSSSEGLPSFEAANSKTAAPASVKKVAVLEQVEDGRYKIPDFTGLDIRSTLQCLEKGNLELVPYGSGRAFQQAPSPGAVVEKGTKIRVWFK